jgi:hypothetical protein
MASTLERQGQHPLVAGTGARLPPRLDLSPVGYIPPQPSGFLVVDGLGLVDAKGADPPATETTAASPAWALAAGTTSRAAV